MSVFVGGTEEEIGFFEDIELIGIGYECWRERGGRRFGEESDESRGRVQVESQERSECGLRRLELGCQWGYYGREKKGTYLV